MIHPCWRSCTVQIECFEQTVQVCGDLHHTAKESSWCTYGHVLFLGQYIRWYDSSHPPVINFNPSPQDKLLGSMRTKFYLASLRYLGLQYRFCIDLCVHIRCVVYSHKSLGTNSVSPVPHSHFCFGGSVNLQMLNWLTRRKRCPSTRITFVGSMCNPFYSFSPWTTTRR